MRCSNGNYLGISISLEMCKIRLESILSFINAHYSANVGMIPSKSQVFEVKTFNKAFTLFE